MDEAESLDRIAIVDGGKIIAIGTPAELKAMCKAPIESSSKCRATTRNRCDVARNARHS